MFCKTCSEVTWVLRVAWGFLVFLGEMISCFSMLMRHYENFRSPCCIQIPSRPVSCIGGWMQLIAEKEILIVVASLVHCAIKKNVIVASRLYDVADVQFTVEKEGPLELLQFIQKYNLGNSVPKIAIMLRIFLTIAVSVAIRERSFSKLKLIKNYLRSSMSTLRLRYLTTLSIE